MQVRKLIRRLLIVLALLLAVGIFWYQIFQHAPTSYKVTHRTFVSTKVPKAFNNFKIGVISDFDIQSSADYANLTRCLTKLNAENCDMVIFAGDMFESGKIIEREKMVSALKSVKATSGKLAVLGENEYRGSLEDAIAILEEGGFEVLRNQAHPVYFQDQAIQFAGLEAGGDVDALLSEEARKGFVLAAVHQPDYFTEIAQSSCTLQLSGHSGGGFIHLPFIGSLVHFEGCEHYNYGKYTQNQSTLMITNGIGMGHEQQARFDCPPGPLVVTLKKAAK